MALDLEVVVPLAESGGERVVRIGLLGLAQQAFLALCEVDNLSLDGSEAISVHSGRVIVESAQTGCEQRDTVRTEQSSVEEFAQRVHERILANRD